MYLKLLITLMMNGTTVLFIQVVGLFLNEYVAYFSDLSEDLSPERYQFLGTQVDSLINKMVNSHFLSL